VGVLLFVVNVFISRKRGIVAGSNPWDAYTLEWATDSPPPPYNFRVLPTVRSGYPLWEDRLLLATRDDAPHGASEPNPELGRSSIHRGALLDEGKQIFATTPLEAEANSIVRMPEDSHLPLALAAALLALFYGAVFSQMWLVAVGAALTLAIMIAWLWPRSFDGGPVA
jgi:cytochrome c oxidase subunit 1/cytochrome c oxidase subunit I+III